MKIKLARIVLVFAILSFIFAYKEVPKWQNYADDNLHVYFFDVEEGDSSLIKTPDKKLILIDGGPDRAVIHRISEVMPFWISKIDIVVGSHSHKDHLTGLIYVLEKYDVGCVIYDFLDDPISKIDEKFRKISVNASKSKDNCHLEKLLLTNYLPEFEKSQNNNENLASIISSLSYGDFDVLFATDAEIPEQNDFLKQFRKDIEIIKVPHHGARNAFNPLLIKSLTPELGVISVGPNHFGHPHIETLNGYRSLGVRILRTDQEGTIHIKSDGFSWEVVK